MADIDLTKLPIGTALRTRDGRRARLEGKGTGTGRAWPVRVRIYCENAELLTNMRANGVSWFPELPNGEDIVAVEPYDEAGRAALAAKEDQR